MFEITEQKGKVSTAKKKACFRSPAGVSSGSGISSFCKRPALKEKAQPRGSLPAVREDGLVTYQSRTDRHSVPSKATLLLVK